MSKILVITLWDYKRDSSQRARYLVEGFKARGSEITVLYKKRNIFGSFLSFMKDSFFFLGSSGWESDVRLIEVDPFLNYSAGLGAELGGAAEPNKKRMSFLSLVLSHVGSIKDLVIVFSMVLCFLFKVKGKFDICICLGVWESAIGYLLKKTGRVAFLVYDDRDYEPGFQVVKFRQMYTAWSERFLMKRADLITSVGSMLAELRRQQTGKEVVVVSNGADYNLFKTAQEKEDHPPGLGYMGEVNYLSGLDVVVKALQGIREKIPDIRLYIMGSGSPLYEAELRNMARETGVHNNVVFCGTVRHGELPQMLKKIDIGLACFRPVYWRIYAFPYKVIEYMAAGLPVIGTAGTETERIIKTYNCGEVVNLERQDLVRSISTILQDKERFNQLSFNAKKHSRSFDWAFIMEKNFHCITDRFKEMRV